MERAAVLIGVNRTGGLPVLQDATRSARRMEAWARAQGVQHVAVFTDEDGKEVEISAIKTAITQLSERGTIEQLLVFFAGHGINVNRGERWLLSGAPADSQAAVNVPGSAEFARWGAIPYVVMISDACRTAAQSIQAQGMTGSEIFPNLDLAELELPVDQFFACRLGRPALEILDPHVTAREYKAIYTAALLGALNGQSQLVLDALGYVRPRPLKRFLQGELTRRLRDLNLATRLIQTPDAHVSSGEEEWISYVGGGGGVGGGSDAPDAGDGEYSAQEPPAPAQPSLESDIVIGTVSGAVGAILEPVITDRMELYFDRVQETRASADPHLSEIASRVEREALPFGPTHFETGCGFKIRGAPVREAVAHSVRAEQLNDELVRLHLGDRRGGTVLLVLASGLGLALPAIGDFITSVTVDGDDVVGVAYEPSEGTERWNRFSQRAAEVRALRAVVASASREGVFELEGDDAYEIARRMRYVKAIDPALAVYAAYAFADIGRRALVREMEGVMRDDLGVPLFDVAMLARRPAGNSRELWEHETFGFAPLLAQGWALVSATRRLRPWLEELEPHVLPTSLWTLYDEAGADLIRSLLLGGALE